MALKAPLWMMGHCLEEERKYTRLSHLAARVLDLGLRGTDRARGHIFQSWGAVQRFLDEYPQHKSTIRSASPVEPFAPAGSMLTDWKTFLAQQPDATYGQPRFGYSWTTLRGYLTPKYGGTRTGGGGGDNEFEIVLRIAAEFL
jgi:hypothetical protein